MMMGGATIEEYNKYVGDKAGLTSTIKLLENGDLPLYRTISEVKYFDRDVKVYIDYKEKYGLEDPWLENILSNTMMMELRHKLKEMKVL